MPSWPGTLPQKPLYAGLSETHDIQATVIRTQMDVGPPKVRPRAAIDFRHWTVQQRLTQAQRDTLVTFWRDTLQRGALSFTWTDFDTFASSVDYRFEAAPVFVREGADLYRVTMNLEQMP